MQCACAVCGCCAGRRTTMPLPADTEANIPTCAVRTACERRAARRGRARGSSDRRPCRPSALCGTPARQLRAPTRLVDPHERHALRATCHSRVRGALRTQRQLRPPRAALRTRALARWNTHCGMAWSRSAMLGSMRSRSRSMALSTAPCARRKAQCPASSAQSSPKSGNAARWQLLRMRGRTQ